MARNWQFTLPADFSNRENWENAGWIETEKFDLKGEIRGFAKRGIGTVMPAEKHATLIVYQNNDLGLRAGVLEYFNQGVLLLRWYKYGAFVDISKPLKLGYAIYEDGRWITKRQDQKVLWIEEKRGVGDLILIERAAIGFYVQDSNGSPVYGALINLAREE